VKKLILYFASISTLFLTTMVFARKKILFYLSTVGLLLVSMLSGTTVQAQCPTVTIPTPVCAGGNCGAGTPLTVSGDTAGITNYEWVITGGGATDTVRGKDPVYSFANPGSYQISLRITRNGVVSTCPVPPVNVQGFGEFTIGPDNNLGPEREEICKGTSITLEAVFQQGGPPPGATYLWSRGETTPTITTDSAGCYSVTITDPATGCSRSAKVDVTVYKPDPNQPPPPREESRWYFGNGSGIKFVGGQPQPITGNANTPEGTSSISDASGNFLFYTDGRNVFDKNGNPMKDRNGNNVTIAANNALNGGPNSTQSVLIIAQPGCNDCEPVYYVFTTTDIGAGGSRLEYSVVDMRLNGGLGQVTQKNVPLFDTSTERLATIEATPDSTNPQRPATTWIVTHDFNSNTFRVYPLTARGVGSPKTYSVGNTHGSATDNGEGYLKVYDDKVVVVIPGAAGQDNIVQVFDFDAATGEITGPPNTINLGTSPPKAYGVEIVGDSTLYVSLAGSGADSSRILGFNLSSGVDSTIQKSRRSIFATTQFTIGALQLDPNGQRLFVAQQNRSALGEITSPGTLASAGYNTQGVALNAPAQLGLPSSKPPNNQSTGQGFAFSPPQCTAIGDSSIIRFQAQPDRAGGDSLKSAYQWRFFNASNTFTQEFARGNGTTPGYGINYSVSVTFPGPGTYTAELTIYNDCTDLNTPGGARPETFRQQVIIPVQPPKPTARDTSNCLNTRIQLDPYPGLPGPAGVTYRWVTPANDTIPGRNIQAVQPGLYTVIIQSSEVNGQGQFCVETGSVRVNYTAPTVNLGRDTVLCSNSTLVLNAGIPGARYEWFNPANQSLGTGQTLTVTPASSTFYRVRVTDLLTGCSDEDTLLVTVSRRPRITPTVVHANSCAVGDPGSRGTVTLTTSDADASTFVYRWIGDGGEIPVAPSTTSLLLAPGIYRILVLKPGGCDTTLTVAVENRAPDAPQFSSNAPIELGCNETEGTLTLTRTDGTPGNRVPTTLYRLVDQNGQFPLKNGQIIPGTSGTAIPDNLTIAGLLPGVYRLEGTYSSNCRFAFTYEIQSPPNKPVIQAASAITGCQTAVLSVAGNTANASIKWRLQGGGELQPAPDGSVTVTQSGVYIVTATSTLPPNCATEDTVTITFPPISQVAVKPSPSSCVGQEILLEAEVTTAFDSYAWIRPDGSVFAGTSIVATQALPYRLVGRNTQTGCADTLAVTPNFVPTPEAPVVAPPTSICKGSEPPTLVLSGSNFRWYDNPQLTGTPISTSPGFKPPINTRNLGTYTYYVTQSTDGGCEGPATAVTFRVVDAPVLNLGPDRQACPSDSVVLNATVTNPGATYSWNTGQTTPILTVTRAGTYVVSVSAGTCVTRDTIVITYLPAPTVNLQRREVPLCFADGAATATLDAGPGSNYTYEWREAGNPVVIGAQRTLIVNNLGVFTVTVSNGSTCKGIDTVRVVNKCEPRVSIPDAFTPNDDGSNDQLDVFHAYVVDFKLLIFNRWGEVIFASDSPEIRWDGTYKGQQVPPGTYTWKVVYKAEYYRERPEIEVRGAVLLLR
jgi:gliding motility-associated-like protein